MDELNKSFFSKYKCSNLILQMFKMAPSSGLDLQQALVQICPHFFKERNCNEMKPTFDQYFFGGAGKNFSLYKASQKEIT